MRAQRRVQLLVAALTALLVIPIGPVAPALAANATSVSLVVAPATATYGEAITLTATVQDLVDLVTPVNAGSVTFASGATTFGTAPVSAGTATLVTDTAPAGDYPDVVASFQDPGDAYGASDSSASPQTLSIGKAGQAITFTSAAPAASVGGALYTPTATATSGLGVTFSIAAASSAICSISAGAVSFSAAGTCTIHADQAGDANWSAAPRVSQDVTVGAGAQATLAITGPATRTYGDGPFVPTTSGGSGTGAVTFTSSTPSICTASSSASVTIVAAGTCTISATKAADADYGATTSAPFGVTVQKAGQAITFTSAAPAASVGGALYTPTATATSGLGVTFSIAAASSAICSISAGAVSFSAAGTCTIHADQAGDANWSAAPRVSQDVTVGAGAQATLAITGPATRTYGDGPFVPTTSGGSGTGAVTFTSSTPSICTASSSASVTIVAAGTCTISATKAADADYGATTSAPFGVTVQKAGQAITFTSAAPAASVGGALYTPTATATSGLGVTFSIAAASSAICSISAGAVSFSAAGTCTIHADQAGDANWSAAPRVSQDVTVGAGAQATLAITGPATRTYGDGPFVPTTSGGSGTGAVTFTSSTPSICTASSSASVTIVAAGTCTISATKAADADYGATTSAPFGVTVQKAGQAITFTSAAPAASVGGALYTPTATATSGLGVTFSIAAASSAICSISAGAVSFSAAGTCTIHADQAGDANWSAAPRVSQDVTVGAGAQATLAITGPATRTYGDGPFVPTTSGGSGTGAVTFTSSTPSICTASSSASVTIVAAGTCTISATKAADADYGATTSAPFGVTVQKAGQAALAVNASSPAPFGSVQTLSTIGGSGTGDVTYSTGASTACSVLGDQLTIVASTGTCTVTATKAADANYTARTSAPSSITVSKASTTVALASDDATSVYGQSVTFTATVVPTAPGAGIPGGTVQLRVDGLNAGAPIALSGGAATFSTSTLSARTHAITADYAGDASFVGSFGTLAGGQDVAKATLSVTADNKTRLYGGANPALTASYSGFANGETLTTAGVAGSPTLATTATQTSPVIGSPYPITASVGTLLAANYSFAFTPGALTVIPATTTVTLRSSLNPAPPGQAVTLTATVGGLPTLGGTVDFQAWDGSAFVTFESTVLASSFSASTASITLPATEGERQYRAELTSPDSNYANGSGLLVQSIGRSDVTVTLSASRPKWESTVPLTFTATIVPNATGVTVPIGGTVVFSIDGTPLPAVTVAAGRAALPAQMLGAGAHQVTAAYSGDGSFRGGTAAPIGQIVTANVVEASSVAMSGSTIYPYRDTWRDTITIRGSRTERLSVTIRIYKPSGSVLTTRTFSAGTGAYASVWNGRTNSGSILPAGRYRVVQTLSDPSSVPTLRKSWTSYVTLSTKRMVWRTVSLYRNANAPSRWSGPPSLLSSTRYGTGARLVTSSPPGWAAFGYSFTLPSATAIKSVAFYVQGGPWSGGTPATAPKIGLNDWRTSASFVDSLGRPCPSSDWCQMYSPVRARRAVGASTSAWYGVAGDPAAVVTTISGKRYVRAFVDTGSYVAGFRYEVGRVRIVVTYGVLR